MREIKFRSWGPNAKHMWHWDEMKGVALINLNQGEAITMQFTGLLDKNGVEIYEGDIIMAPTWGGGQSHRAYVEYRGHKFDIVPIKKPMKIDRMLFFESCWGSPNKPDTMKCEVIGNIYENPELLQETSNPPPPAKG